MRKLKSLMFAAIMLLSSFGASAIAQQPTAPPPLQAAEYNVGYCSGRGFDVLHVVISPFTRANENDNAIQTISTPYRLTSPTVVSKTEDNVPTFVVKKYEVLKDGSVGFQANAIVKDRDGKDVSLAITGGVYKDKIAFLMTVDGELGSIWYGHVGKVDDMVKDVEDDEMVCGLLHQIDSDSFPEFISKYLHQDDAPKDNTAPVAPKP